MADYAVSTVFKGKDGITGRLNAMGAAAGQFGRKTEKSFDRANRKALTFKTTVGAILSAGMISRGVGLMTRGIRGLAEEFVTFDDAITKAGAKFPVMVKRGTKEFSKLEATARDVGAKTKFSATEAAEGLDFLAMAGFDADQAMAALPLTAELAIAAGEDLARATDIASDALGAFNLMSKDTGQLTINLSRVNDVFAKTVTSANTTMELMFETMKDGGPVMTAAGASIETFAALTGAMANAGIKGSKAGTTLKNMFTKLQDPVPKAQKLLKKLKIELIDEEGKLRDIIDILGDFNDRTKNMGAAQRSAAIDTIFGQRAIAGVSVLLTQGRDALKKYRESLIDSKGAASAMAEEMQKSLGNRLKALKSAVIELGFKFIDAFKDKIPGSVNTATEAIRNFDVRPIVRAIQDFRNSISNLMQLFRDLKPLIELVVVSFISYKAVLLAAIAIKSIKHYMQLSAAINAATGAQSALNVAMAANPIGVVIAAVAGLITAGVMLYRQWDNIRQLWRFFIEEVKTGWRWLKSTKVGDFLFGEEDAAKTVANTKTIETANSKRRAKVQTMLEDHKRLTEQMEAQRKAGKAALGQFAVLEEGRRGFVPTPATGRIMPRGFGGAGGFGGARRQAPGRTAPNKEDVAAQQIQFKGKLIVAGAPEGSKIEATTTGAPPIKTELMGANL